MRPPARQYGTLAQPLDEILGTVSRVRVLRELDRSEGPHAVAGIAKQTGLTHNAVLTAIDLLTNAGIVDELPMAARTAYRLSSRHPFVAPLVALFAAERRRRQAISDLVRDWAEPHSAALLAVWLFGSAARQEDDFGSDIDLALVARDRVHAVRLAEELRDALATIAKQHSLHPNVVAYDNDEITLMPDMDQEMWASLARDAITLHGLRPDEVQDHHRRRRATHG